MSELGTPGTHWTITPFHPAWRGMLRAHRTRNTWTSSCTQRMWRIWARPAGFTPQTCHTNHWPKNRKSHWPNSPSNGTDQEPLGVRTVTHFIGIPGVPPAAVAEFAASAAHENLDYVEGPWKYPVWPKIFTLHLFRSSLLESRLAQQEIFCHPFWCLEKRCCISTWKSMRCLCNQLQSQLCSRLAMLSLVLALQSNITWCLCQVAQAA